MDSCVPLRREMLINPIDVNAGDASLDFDGAKKIADARAREIGEEPMLLAWFDRKEGRFFPSVACSGRDKPSWLVCAESRGANLVIDVNREAFVFVYLA